MNEQIVWYRQESGNKQEELEEELQAMGHPITISEDPEDLRLLLTGNMPLMLIVELEEPEEWSGWKTIAALREQGETLPVMVISGKATGEGAVAAFKAGGNEYMSRPLHTGEFSSRVRNLLELAGRRRRPALLKIDTLTIDPGRRLVSREEKELKMTPKEFDLLYYLAAHLGEICSRDEILKQIWGYHFHADTNVVDVYIRHLRLKVDKGYRNKLIHTVRGAGYVMRAPENGATC
ncbi:response regulator transcription factor [Paenibacillus albidus]|uniref:response regulator transcription factor n=1 Tax=Paenibacillus albidus TaxID=2041023 RepID=UPI001BEC5137|nr:response regulator transcription factor [Paenibacillus albidus]MBT2287928.1 response regulator transcription factor [Paenibacillus albidus]